MKKRRIRLLIFSLILVLLLSACVPASSEDKTPTDDESSENSQDSTDNNQDDGTDSKEVEFIVAVSTDLVSFDLMNTSAGATNQILYHVYEQLAMLDYTSQLNPQLATSWESNEDCTEWTLYLKENVLFHDGSAFDSEDVVASLNRYARIGQRAALFEGAQIEAIDAYTVKVTLQTENPLFIENLGTEGMGGIVMLPAEYCGEEYDSALTYECCIGTGPYQMASYEPDTQVVLKKNPDYVPDSGESNGYSGEKIAYFDTLTWKIVPDAAQRLNGLLAGEYQYAADLNVSAYSTLEATDGIEIMLKPGD